MDNELKEKIRASMKERLTSKGWPNLTSDQIVNELPNLWKKLEAEGHLKTLIEKGFSYQQFVQIALNQKAMQDMINGFLGKSRFF